eukprot:9490950-Pyramimonas_sp.AAC.1
MRPLRYNTECPSTSEAVQVSPVRLPPPPQPTDMLSATCVCIHGITCKGGGWLALTSDAGFFFNPDATYK